MNNKIFITELSKRVGCSIKETTELMAGLTAELTDRLEEENTVSISSFGNFEVKKKLERVVINPSTKQRMLVPPKLSLTFKPSTILKEKL